MLVCVFLHNFARETAGAARIRHSPRPLILVARNVWANLGWIEPRECRVMSAKAIERGRATPTIVMPGLDRGEVERRVPRARCLGLTPLPNPPPQGGREQKAPRHEPTLHAYPSRRLRRLQSELRLDLLAHHELLDLAVHRHGKFVDEFDVARNLVVRDLSLAERADLVGRQGLARARPDPGAELLAVAGVSYSATRRRCVRRVRGQAQESPRPAHRPARSVLSRSIGRRGLARPTLRDRPSAALPGQGCARWCRPAMERRRRRKHNCSQFPSTEQLPASKRMCRGNGQSALSPLAGESWRGG
jgi:hypothetical protein